MKDSKVEGVSGESIPKSMDKVYPTRQIDPVAEAHIIDRVKEIRGNLTSKYKKSGNFAIAEVEIAELSKKEFYAQSEIDSLSGNLVEKFQIFLYNLIRLFLRHLMLLVKMVRLI